MREIFAKDLLYSCRLFLDRSDDDRVPFFFQLFPWLTDSFRSDVPSIDSPSSSSTSSILPFPGLSTQLLLLLLLRSIGGSVDLPSIGSVDHSFELLDNQTELDAVPDNLY